jgi:hypothetical protein
MHAGHARHLRQVHGAKFAGPYQADADGAALAGALKQLLVKTHETGGRESAARGEAGARRQAAGAWVKPGPP